MEYCGLDVGKKSSHFCVKNEEGEIIRRGQCKTNPEAIARKLKSLNPVKIVIEASYCSFWLAEELENKGFEVVVCDPGRTKAIGSGRIKHDKLDAEILAGLLRVDFLAKVDKPKQEERFRRMPQTTRNQLVRSRTRLANCLRSALASEGINIAGRGAAAVLRAANELELPDAIRVAIEPLVSSIEALNKSIDSIELTIRSCTEDSEVMKLLQTVDGVGPLTASAFVNVIREPKRFKNGRRVAAYLGLVPSLYSSGKIHRVGGITKRGNRTARWLLTMSANALLRSKKSSRLKRWALELVERLGRKKAIVAVARKLAMLLWKIWLKMTPFDAEHLPEPNVI